MERTFDVYAIEEEGTAAAKMAAAGGRSEGGGGAARSGEVSEAMQGSSSEAF